MQIHTGGVGPITPWGTARKSFYGVSGIPDVWIDGLAEVLGGEPTDPENYDRMMDQIEPRWDVPTPLTIQVFAEEVDEQTYLISGLLSLEEGGEPLTFRLHLANLLFGHPEAADHRYNNCVMGGAELGDFTLNPGQSAVVTHEVTFNSTSWANRDNIRIAMFAQEPAAVAPAEVYQAGIMSWPFPPLLQCPADFDGDENVGTTDLLQLLAAWGNAGGEEDINGDGVVNTADLLALLASWGPCPVEPTGACCVWDGTCVDATWYECQLIGHAEWFEGEECSTFPCPELPIGACCIITDCVANGTAYECSLLEGVWYEGEECPGFDCQPDYCDAEGGCTEYISRVAIGAIGNSSACDNYGDYTYLSTDMVIGYGYGITIWLADANAGDRGGAWIDWNRDGDFEDPSEEITVDWSGTGPYNDVLFLPPDAVLGPTRLRVRLTRSEPPTPCGSHTFGEVEDYTVNILPPPRK